MEVRLGIRILNREFNMRIPVPFSARGSRRGSVRDVLRCAEKEAYRSGSSYVGTEHLLVATLACNAAIRHRVLPPELARDVKSLRGRFLGGHRNRDTRIDRSRLPEPSEHYYLALAYMLQEQRTLGHRYASPESLLLALARGPDFRSATLLNGIGLDYETLRHY